VEAYFPFLPRPRRAVNTFTSPLRNSMGGNMVYAAGRARMARALTTCVDTRGGFGMFDRISRSWELAKSSWHVLCTDKHLVIFPIVSGIALLIVLASFAVPIGILEMNGHLRDADGHPPIWLYPVAFAFYFCNYFVIVFCNSALISCALMRLNGETPTLGDGFSIAFSRLPQIAAWSLVSATVGLLLKLVENAHERVGEFISAILGAAWSIMTYFVVPILVVEKVGPFEAVSRSMSVLRKTWGEALVGNFSLGLMMLLLAIPGFLLLIGGAVLLHGNMVAPGIALIVLALLYFLGCSVISSALNSIFLAALYQYAAYNRVAVGFDREMFSGAFSRRRGE
jgi:hypothetical protein